MEPAQKTGSQPLPSPSTSSSSSTSSSYTTTKIAKMVEESAFTVSSNSENRLLKLSDTLKIRVLSFLSFKDLNENVAPTCKNLFKILDTVSHRVDGRLEEYGPQQDSWGRPVIRGKMTYQNHVVAKGLFRNKQLTFGEIIYPSGRKEEGSFVDQVRPLEGKEQGLFQGLFRGLVPDGEGLLFYATLLHGHGMITYRGGKQENGSFQSGLLHGPGAAHLRDRVESGVFEKGLLNGLGKITYRDGRVEDGAFIAGVLSHGMKIEADKTELVGIFNKNGQLHGEGQITYPDKSVVKGRFKNGRYVGKKASAVVPMETD